MINNINVSEISSFLAKAKNLLSSGDFDFVPRKKNLQALSEIGFTILDAKNEIFSLVVDDYYKGPKEDFDKNQPGLIWEFKKSVGNKQFYVKLKIQDRDGRETLKCLSFHEDDFS